MSLSHEVPAHLRRLPRGKVAVRITKAASSMLYFAGIDAGWVALRTSDARAIAKHCRWFCSPKKRGKYSIYSGAEKLTMRRLAEQIEARLAP